MRCDNLRARPLHSYTLQGSATSPWIVEDTNRAYRHRRGAIRTATLPSPRRAQTDRRTSAAVTAERDRAQAGLAKLDRDPAKALMKLLVGECK